MCDHGEVEQSNHARRRAAFVVAVTFAASLAPVVVCGAVAYNLMMSSSGTSHKPLIAPLILLVGTCASAALGFVQRRWAQRYWLNARG